MKTIEETLLNRTSVRRYEYDKIPTVRDTRFHLSSHREYPDKLQRATILGNSYRRSIH